MVLIHGENNIIKGNRPSFMKLLEERKKTIEIFTTPLKEIIEEPQNIVEEDKTPIVISETEMKILFGSK
jgi:hypothetical protein